MTHRVFFSPEARQDLFNLYSYIEANTGAGRALAYIDRIESYCLGFSTLPERGTRRDDIRPGLRLIGFERRVAIAFHVMADAVVIDRILYGCRDVLSKIGPSASTE